MSEIVSEQRFNNSSIASSFANSALTATLPTSKNVPSSCSTAAAAAAAVNFPAVLESNRRQDQELETKVKRTCERISENLHISANEPSLALYRLAEHVRKALPPTVESRQEVKRLQRSLKNAYSNAENDLDVVRSMEKSSPSLSNAKELLKNSIFLQQQINYEVQKSGRREPSMYQRLSAHIQSVDLPDFSELKETAKETASRVESALSRGGSTDSSAHQSGIASSASNAWKLTKKISPSSGSASNLARTLSLNNQQASSDKYPKEEKEESSSEFKVVRSCSVISEQKPSNLNP